MAGRQANDTIGPYTLVRSLGHGAFGEVWLAERRSSLLTTQVALKLPLDATADLDVIRQEAQIWLRASGHPNIVPVLEAEVYDGQVVIASEYVAGGSLQDWLAQHGGKAPSVEAAVKVVTATLAGLEHLHSNHLVHRDLKPDNVLLQSSLPRLTDFGLTRVLKPTGHTTNMAGTPGYMAPEAFKGHYSPASDVWAAGMLLHELFVGALPYPQTDFYSLFLAITSDDPVVLSDHVPRALRPVLAKALAKPVAERFASADELAEALAMAMRPLPAAAVAEPRPRHNLPVQTTSFIGRQKEIQGIRTLLGKTRLLALTGSAGCGKTRLSLQAAAEVVEEYPDGVWFVELAPLVDPALVPQAVAQALNVTEEPGTPLLQTLAQFLKTKELLLILDNCEHLLTACSRLVDRLIHACPDVRVLASSREGLNIAGELTYRVPSLSIPQSGHTATAQSVRQYESVRLFVERAQFHQPSFTLTDSNAPSLASVCQRLDGIPLAIELATARVRSMTVDELGQRLDNRFRILTGGSRTALPRQQTLRALIDWSYDLLEENQKSLLCRISVFAGGWTVEAAEQVCRGGALDDWEIVDLVTALCDKSLVVADAQGETTRYRLLETVRQYAREKLALQDDAKTYRGQHRDYFLKLAEDARPRLRGLEQAHWLSVLETEHDNLRQALTFCLEQPEGGDAGLCLGAALSEFWQIRGHLSEGRVWLAALLARPERQEGTIALADALNGAGDLSRMQGDCASARPLYQKSLEILRELGDRRGIARSLGNLGLVDNEQGSYASARSYLEQSLEIYQALGDRQGLAETFNTLGNVAQHQGLYASARSLYQETLTIWRELKDLQGIARSLNNLGLVAHNQGDYSSAQALCGEALTISRQLGHRTWEAFNLSNLGNVAFSQNLFATASARYQESLEIQRELGDKRGIALSLGNLGVVAAEQGSYAAAWTFYQESVEIYRELGDKRGVARSLGNLGAAADNQGDHMSARPLFQESLEIYREAGDQCGVANSLSGLGCQARYEGDNDAARSLHQESLDIYRELGDRRGAAISLCNLGEVALCQGEFAVARLLLREGLSIDRDLGDKQAIAHTMEVFAGLNARDGKLQQAVQLWGAVQRFRDETGQPMPPNEQDEYDRAVTGARQALGDEAFSAAWTEGRAMTVEQAIQYALEISSD